MADSPFISLTSDDNSISLSMQFSTEKIETTSDSINEKINKLILKRAILMVYVNEIYNGNVTLSEDNRTAINAYVNVIKENASFLNGNRGMVKNQLGMASDLLNNQSNENIVNYYIIKSGEALEIRSNKIDSTISAIDSITNILEQNLTSSSCYYQNSLTNAYNNMISNMKNNTLTENENQKIAKEIAESIDILNDSNINYDNQITTQPLNTNNKSITKSNCIDCKKTTNTINNPRINNISNSPINKTTDSTINQNNNIMTLDEKTQNRSNISENNTNNYENSNYYNNLTPSQRAKLRRRNKLENNTPTNPTLNTDNNNAQINSNTQNTTAPRTELNNRNTNNQTRQNYEYNQTRNNNNRAVRVPYRTSSNITD